MNAGQQQFYNFILDKVREDKKEEAESLLAESFEKQEDGSFNAAYLAGFVPKMAGMLKPECLDEAKSVMAKFGGSAAVSSIAGNVLGGLFGAGK